MDVLKYLRSRGLGYQPKGRYTFAVGIGFVRTVTVVARDYDVASQEQGK